MKEINIEQVIAGYFMTQNSESVSLTLIRKIANALETSLNTEKESYLVGFGNITPESMKKYFSLKNTTLFLKPNIDFKELKNKYFKGYSLSNLDKILRIIEDTIENEVQPRL